MLKENNSTFQSLGRILYISFIFHHCRNNTLFLDSGSKRCFFFKFRQQQGAPQRHNSSLQRCHKLLWDYVLIHSISMYKINNRLQPGTFLQALPSKMRFSPC